MNKVKLSLIAASFVCLSSNSFASESLPDILKNVDQQSVELIDESAQAKLRGEYISDKSKIALSIKQALFCFPGYIICKGTQYISPTERFIKFSFRSTPNKIEYKSY